MSLDIVKVKKYFNKTERQIEHFKVEIDKLYEEHGDISKEFKWLTPFFEPSDIYRERQIKLKKKQLREIKQMIKEKQKELRVLEREGDIRVDIKRIEEDIDLPFVNERKEVING